MKPLRRGGAAIGLVPTMGALHDGHLSLIREARERCDVVVVTIFVNPTQFNEQADLLAYPRDEERDVALASEAGADVVFAPEPSEIYRPGFCTHVEVEGLTDRLEGAVRGAQHFRGVTTVVCKLLNIVMPEIAFFGQKDAQQAAVVRRMRDDLDLDVAIDTRPTVREQDGLAMSSRNVWLDEAQRARSLALVSALRATESRARRG
ncbi:MAG: pantoate--beta-alanine ligase, partial [Solirubrobacteraceae bacterium]